MKGKIWTDSARRKDSKGTEYAVVYMCHRQCLPRSVKVEYGLEMEVPNFSLISHDIQRSQIASKVHLQGFTWAARGRRDDRHMHRLCFRDSLNPVLADL